MDEPQANEFEKAASEETGGSLLVELGDFLRHNKKWWLTPILLLLLLTGLLIILSTSAAAPFIYTLF